jgi:Fe-S oxidoreductase
MISLDTDANRMPDAIRRDVFERCINCECCWVECDFIQKYGKPKHIADTYDPEDAGCLKMAFECSLCSLCTAVCPVGLDPAKMFLEMRREAVDRRVAPLAAHKGIMAYEGRGVSPKYSWYSLPKGCAAVFFPGCTFSGTRMDTTLALYGHLKTKIPEMGIVLDCCCKPSHDLGRHDFFNEMFNEMKNWLTDRGVSTIIVACPNCYKVFRAYGPPLEVKSVYEFLAETGLPEPAIEYLSSHPNPQPVSVHDPCVLRDETAIQDAVRQLAKTGNFVIEEMPHSKKKTLCCGEGGAVGCVALKLSETWGDLRRKEAGDRRLLTYCAGCAGLLNKKIPTDHILDALFYPETVATGKRKVSKAPFTYFNRIRLKRCLQKNHPAPVTRERNFFPESVKTGPKIWNRLFPI